MTRELAALVWIPWTAEPGRPAMAAGHDPGINRQGSDNLQAATILVILTSVILRPLTAGVFHGHFHPLPRLEDNLHD